MRWYYFVVGVLLAVFIITPITSAHAAHHRDGATATHDHGGANAHEAPHHTGAAHTPGGHWSAPATEQTRVNPLPLRVEGLISAGEIYRQNCAACHGAAGQGDGPLAKDLERAPANLMAMAPHHSEGDLRWKVAKGRGEMPGWEETLSDEQIWHLVHYMKTLPAYHQSEHVGHQ